MNSFIRSGSVASRWEWGMGSGEWGVGNRESGMEDWQLAISN